MNRTLWWPGSAVFLEQERPTRREVRAGPVASLFAGLVLAAAVLALLY